MTTTKIATDRLTGTPRQVAWARRIQDALYCERPTLLTLQVFATRTDASFWIDHRESSYEQIISDAFDTKIVSGPFTFDYPRYGRQEARETLSQLRETDYLVLDIETTGLSTKKHEMIELAIADGGTGRVLFDSLLRPHELLQEETAQELTGITAEMLTDAPTLPDVWEELRDMLTSAHLITFNASFDIPFIRAEARKWGLDVPPLHATCLMRLATAYFDCDHWLTLTEAADLLEITTASPQAHRAAADARVAADVLRAMLR